ncbi:related to cytochrome P450 CYP2 subfamily [Armillaria ostoyae]|uniref:Related to cytochrome P450 CYP2 subfamily n=1 Tax=Armillaria ostoyae TaxID=47428 RepID=A0A284RLZ1_ARMOS|nr:related to cytochrome P450 CYP2 subfamily [Armillaria ostoyae]
MNSFLLLASLGALLLYRLLSSIRRRRLPLPPGPKGLPLIGNLWDVPAEYPWLTYAQWAATYGDVFYLDTPGNPTVVINSAQAVADIFEKRSGNYSDRPDFTMSNLAGWEGIVTFMRYSNWWRKHRRMLHGYFQLRAVPAYHPVQVKATSTLLQQLLKSPDEISHHVRHHAGSIIMKIVYGYDVNPNGDTFVGLVDRAMESARIIGNLGTFLVDYIPSLQYLPRWFPGTKFMSLADGWRKDVHAMQEEPFKYALESLDSGTASSSLVSVNLAKMNNIGVSEKRVHLEVIRNTASVAFAGRLHSVFLVEHPISCLGYGCGHSRVSLSISFEISLIDTQTVSTVLSTILAFLLYPEVQAKAQAELDAVVGHTRLPNFDDRAQLPYINAVVLEALRWNPVTPMGVAHRSVKEDVYRGYYIPAGATIVGNVWAILHDEKDYPNPLVFDPNRFMPEDEKEPQPEPTAAFGFGRRVCPGRHLALNTVWIAIASMAATLSFSKAVDSEGRVVEPSDTFTDGLLSFPAPFKCTIKARSAQAKALIDLAEL